MISDVQNEFHNVHDKTKVTLDEQHSDFIPARSGWTKLAAQQRVAFGVPIARALPEAMEMFPMHRVLVVTNNSLAGPGGLADTVRKALGSADVATVSGVRAHTPREDVIRITKSLAEVEGVVTIGGGSVCDAVKAARLCLANGVTDAKDIDRLLPRSQIDGSSVARVVLPKLPFIAIPTTLSVAEFTSMAGVTDERGPRKEGFDYPGLAPDVVVLDPAMTRDTPPRLWLGTGVRAIDHAVETWCSTNATPLSDAFSIHGARLLIHALKRSHKNPADIEARLECQEGAWLSIQGSAAGVNVGASHGIGHALGGTANMPHGETSCVMLPHVLRYNAEVNSGRQEALAEALGETNYDLADIIARLVTRLGLPGRLRDAGVQVSQLSLVASAAMRDPFLAVNPRPITSEADVLQLLQAAW